MEQKATALPKMKAVHYLISLLVVVPLLLTVSTSFVHYPWPEAPIRSSAMLMTAWGATSTILLNRANDGKSHPGLMLFWSLYSLGTGFCRRLELCAVSGPINQTSERPQGAHGVKCDRTALQAEQRTRGLNHKGR